MSDATTARAWSAHAAMIQEAFALEAAAERLRSRAEELRKALGEGAMYDRDNQEAAKLLMAGCSQSDLSRLAAAQRERYRKT